MFHVVRQERVECLAAQLGQPHPIERLDALCWSGCLRARGMPCAPQMTDGVRSTNDGDFNVASPHKQPNDSYKLIDYDLGLGTARSGLRPAYGVLCGGFQA